MSALDTTRSELEPRYAAPLRIARTSADVVDALVAATVGATSPSLLDIRLYEEIRHYWDHSQKVEDVLRAVEAESLAMHPRFIRSFLASRADPGKCGMATGQVPQRKLVSCFNMSVHCTQLQPEIRRRNGLRDIRSVDLACKNHTAVPGLIDPS